MDKEIVKGLLENLIYKYWDEQKEIEPLVFMETPEGPAYLMIRELMRGATEKRGLSDIIRAMVRIKKASICAMMTEVWMAEFEGDNAEKLADEAIKKYETASKVPEKIETVILLIWTKDSTHAKIWAIDRTQAQINWFLGMMIKVMKIQALYSQIHL